LKTVPELLSSVHSRFKIKDPFKIKENLRQNMALKDNLIQSSHGTKGRNQICCEMKWNYLTASDFV